MTSVRPGRAGSLVLRRAALTAGLPGPGAVAQDGGDNRAEHGGDAERERAAAGPQREGDREGGDRERGHGDQHGVAEGEAAGRSAVADQADRDPAQADRAGRAGRQHQRLADLVGRDDRDRDRGHGPAHAGRRPDGGIRRDKRHVSEDTPALSPPPLGGAMIRPMDDAGRVAAFRERAGLASRIDVHTHFMPERLLAAVRAYFDAAGPLIGRPWPIFYRQDEQARVDALRSFGVSAFTAMLYPHKPEIARSLNDWGADFAARTPDCLHTATFFAEPSAASDVRRALDQGARVFKVHLQVGDFDPNDPQLTAAWGQLAQAGVPVVTHCGSGPVPGRFTGPGPVAALMAAHPRLRLV